MQEPRRGTNADHFPRIFHVSKCDFRVPFRIEPYLEVAKTPITKRLSAIEKGAAGSWGRAGRANPVWGRGGVGT
jgi:hypothetical protein